MEELLNIFDHFTKK